MLFKTILNRVEKHASFVYGEVSLNEGTNGLLVEVKIHARTNGRLICSGCWRQAPYHDTLKERRFQYVPVWGIPVFFRYKMRRVKCKSCAVRVEELPWSRGKSPLCRSFSWFLAKWAQRMDWSQVATIFETNWRSVYQSVKMAVEWGRQHLDLSELAAIGVDEIQWQRGHKYLTLVYQIDRHRKRLLWVGRDRKAKTLLRFFRWLGKERSAAITFICSDMWKPYLKVIAKKAAQAVHVLDRFHIMATMNKAIDQIRAEESRKLKEQGYEPVLKNSRWLLLKRPDNLTDSQDIKLAELLQYNLKAVRSYLLREDFQFFWTYVSQYWAGAFLDRWCTKVMRSRIEPMKKVARSLRSHRELILNWFRAKGQMSSGVVEGFNNKAKLTTRKAFGFRSFEVIEIALLHTLGDLPEPEHLHRFC